MSKTEEYIRLVYSKDSSFKSIADINERKKVVAAKLEIPIPEDIAKQVIKFLREENHFDNSLLLSKQELYWETLEVMREPLAETKDDDKRLKNIKLKGDVNDLCSKLVSEINALASAVYGEEFKEQAMRAVVSPEERLLKRKKA
jgi:hypothetical protein